MSGTNFYRAMGTLYDDITLFGTGVILTYEDFDSVIRCYNPPIGEYCLDLGSNLEVNVFCRKFFRTARQIVERWGIDNVSFEVKLAYQQGGSRLQQEFEICHLIEPNDRNEGLVPKSMPIQEFYWEVAQHSQRSQVLSMRGFHENPGIYVRWNTIGNQAYGTSPAMDAFGDILQLQLETKRKAQMLDKSADPPLVADVQLKNRPISRSPGGVTYVNGMIANNGKPGVTPIYQISPP